MIQRSNPQNRSAYADVTSGRGNLGGSGKSANNNEEADYYGKSDGKNKKSGPLKKNWAYGKNGEIVYIATGFVGIFDKQPAGGAAGGGGNRSTYSAVGGSTIGGCGSTAGGGSNVGSSYGTLNHSNYGSDGRNVVQKSSGPSVGTTWDLKGNPQNRSAYADVVTSGRGNLGGSGGAGGKGHNDDADYYGKSDGKNKKSGPCKFILLSVMRL
uniref:Uncharacterized protein n=1 Tax=Panagrolaimus davidi TaxID=227884 RepID=A0A914P7N3_9BILA